MKACLQSRLHAQEGLKKMRPVYHVSKAPTHLRKSFMASAGTPLTKEGHDLYHIIVF